ncbi:MAG TPA: nucleotidyltransferase family protein [Polyangiales bacterium]|jgi:dTDP-glucose pyrophosphorylase|nr:nucleotidyltransferase family protein [Polyangiales bacterium]
MWGIIPAAGLGTRIQPLAFSKELLPVGSRVTADSERPKAVSEYVVERMLHAGVDKLCFIISPGKADIVRYYGSDIGGAQICYVVQPQAAGLCDAIFRAEPLVREDEPVLVGLPDTVWFPEDGFAALSGNALSFLLFPVTKPELFDAVVTAPDGTVERIEVKQARPSSNWIWGGFRMSGTVLRELHALWRERDREDAYIGTLVNEYIARGGRAVAVRAGSDYFDVGTLEGYRHAMRRLGATESIASELNAG